MDVSVVMPCRNNAKVIAGQLEALSRQEWHGSWEVIVADNGSTDATTEVIEKHRTNLPQLTLLDASARRGAAYARNAGVAAARAEAIVFCDADDEVGSGWLAAMGQGLTEHDFVAARLDIQKLNLPEIVKTVSNPQAEGLQRVAYPPHLWHASGASLGVKRKVHERVGGFDDTLPYLQDTDYCFRLQLSGMQLHFLKEAVVHYRFKDSERALFHQARHWGQYNVLMYKRYRESMRLDHPWRRHLLRWHALVRRTPCLLDKEQRLAWMKSVGTQIGVLQGSIKYRVPPVAGWLLCILD
jgi:glycosyltransferase involved in cell wall biosynthesis